MNDPLFGNVPENISADDTIEYDLLMLNDHRYNNQVDQLLTI